MKPPRVAMLLALSTAAAAEQNLRIGDLRCEYLENPAGIGETAPRLSWKLASDVRGQRQSAYQILVAASEVALKAGQGDLWNSGKVSTDRTAQIAYAGQPLASRQLCLWKVRVWDKDGKPSAWSAAARWSMGLLRKEDWSAQWISHRDKTPLHSSRQELYLPPPRYYRKDFTAAKSVRRAVLYASALGIYDAYINGRRVSDRMFAPGWSDYRRRVYYNTYDVTHLLTPGVNAAGVILAEGWYSGYVGYGLLVGYGPNKSGRYFYGKTPALLAQLEIEYADGSRETVDTDTSWKVSTGALREADMLMGETFDARLEPRGWHSPRFNDRDWDPAIAAGENGSLRATFSDTAGDREVELGFLRPEKVQAYSGPAVRPIEEIKPVHLAEQSPGVFLFDLGQNFSGVARLKVRGPAGANVRLRFGEMLHQDGRLMTENLRRARAIDTYVLRGDPAGETWTPRFTYHGFRYVEVTGYPGRPGLDAITGIVVHSDTPLTSTFSTSNPMVNQLFRNIVWTQRSNFVELPTDCPQRDERLGWTGDAQAYVRTAAYNADIGAFYTKWLDDLEEAQRDNGAFPDYAPYPMQHGGGGASWGTAWMDAGIICPYWIYHAYGDTRVIDRHWSAMSRFMQFRRSISSDFQGVKTGNTWGDWLNIASETPIELIDATYFGLTSRLMAEMARATGRTDDAAMYDDWCRRIAERFAKDYLRPGGRLLVDNQTAYSLALSAGLLPPEAREAAAARLAQLIAENGTRMTTGFLGTKPLLPVLSASGHHDLALRLFESREFPSWLYEVDNGATTIWERWNSYTKDKGFFAPAMNSFSHYAFGAVAEWMFSSLAGIDAAEPGYRRILIRPGPPPEGGRAPLKEVSASYDSIRGKIVTRWNRGPAGRFNLEVSIPANTRATVYLPAGNSATITESGRPLAAAEGVKLRGTEDGRAVLEVESGSYRFAVN